MATARFSEPTRTWFSQAFKEPTPAQVGAWNALESSDNILVVAPTGSGKTLAAFLDSLDRLAASAPPSPKERLRVLYVSPLKALAVDIERNLRSPLAGIRNAAEQLGAAVPDIEVGVRTGDTPSEERRRMTNHPPDILITTPESLYLLLTSQARETLRFIDTVIVDEVHAVVATKRGSHLALSLERLDELLEKPARRIGLSATVRPLDEVARFLGGPHPVTVVNPPFEKTLDISVVVPVEDMGALGESSEEIPSGNSIQELPRKTIWPDVEARIVELIREHNSTIVFANSRRLAERLCARINEIAEEELALAHHGSVSKEERLKIEEGLKAGRLPAVVATSSLELGIDMGAVDLVIQVEAPPSVAHGLQRIGRAGHQVGEISKGIMFPKFRGDLLECAVVVERMHRGEIEHLHYPRNPLDVLAQQVVAMVSMDDWSVDALGAVVRRAAPYSDLPESAMQSVLDMLSGRYPSDQFAELRARINWDRATDRLTSRGGSQRIAVVSGGTIPDRGLYGVFLAGEGGTRVGELDEEMVFESRVSDIFILGASSWRIEDITQDKVIVTPAPGEPGSLPFWHGDAPGRPIELGKATGRFLRELSQSPPDKALVRLQTAGLDEWAANNLIQYLEEQLEATGHLSDDKTIVLERFRDELGDWRLCIHSPFGSQIHAPWALAIEASLRETLGVEVQTMFTDDGIIIRLPEADEAPASDAVRFDPDQIEELVTNELGGSALFATRFRECAARALLLPKRYPGRRTPLWQQRQKSWNLLQVAAQYGSFPVILETMRECLQDVFDVPSLKELMSDIESRKVRVVEVTTERASPFASNLLFGYIGAFLYEGEAPLAERRSQALTLDTAALAELLGQAELRELVDRDALEEVELELQRLVPSRQIRNVDDLHDTLRSLGDLTAVEAVVRGAQPSWLAVLKESRRAVRIRVAGEYRWIAIEDAARFRDALGTALPLGIPDAFLEPVVDPQLDLVARYARTHGPFKVGDVTARLGLPEKAVEAAIKRLESAGRLVRGEFRPDGVGTEWCDAEVIRSIRRKSVAAFRREVEPVPIQTLAKFLPAWQGLDGSLRGPDGLYRAIEQLQGAPVPASALETRVLPSRVTGYFPGMLDELCASGEVIWAGSGASGTDDGWVSLYFADSAGLMLPAI
ncbi:MAG: DEAD/DEAH box helicase, partial [Actinobacteria bacterium]|nr:DEAD/DEAH box helicase [Actinomycetota bacterium]